MKKYIYLYIGYITLVQNIVFGADDIFGKDKVKPVFGGGGNNFLTIIDNIGGYIVGLFYFISVILSVYGGFTILTSGGEEDKVKKGKNIIIYVVIGLVIVFLASQIVEWVIDVSSEASEK